MFSKIRFRINKCFLIFIVLFIIKERYIYSQTESFNDKAAGNLYYITLPQIVFNAPDYRFIDNRFNEISFVIYSSEYQQATVTDPKGGVTFLKLDADNIYTHRIVQKRGLYISNIFPLTSGVVSSNSSFKIEAEYPIIVYCYMNTSSGSEAWTPIPADAWGKDYFAAALKGDLTYHVGGDGEFNYFRNSVLAPSQVIITALENNTKVKINNPFRYSNLGKSIFFNPNMNTSNINMNVGQSLLINSRVDSQSVKKNNGNDFEIDLSGLEIVSNKPIGVLSGNTRSSGGEIPRNLAGFAKNTLKNLLIEDMPPVDYHGTNFVYLPAMDYSHKYDFVRAYGTYNGYTILGNIFGFDSLNNGEVTEVDTIKSFHNLVFGKSDGANFMVTNKPSQVFMNTSAFSFTSRKDQVGNISEYNTVSPFMVELVPKENWINKAPFFTGNDLMQHFLVVVTDTVNRYNIKYRKFLNGGKFNIICESNVPNTSYCWTSVKFEPNTNAMLFSENDGKFYAYVYGVGNGIEAFTPGSNLLDDGKDKIQTFDGKSTPQHPAEYKEINSRSYAYPLAPVRAINKVPDSLVITSSYNCTSMNVTVKCVNQNPSGIRLIKLINSNNSKISFSKPQTNNGVINANDATFSVSPINPIFDASAIVVIRDRTGRSKTINYSWVSDAPQINPKSLDFGEVTVNSQSKSLTIKIVNTKPNSLNVQSVDLIFKNAGYVIEKIDPKLPVQLKKWDTITITLFNNFPNNTKRAIDTLRVKYGCSEAKIPLTAILGIPCVYVGDLDFGTLIVGEEETLPLKICNTLGGTLTFNSKDKSGTDIVKWLLKKFSITVDDQKLLYNTILKKDECIYINVKFIADTVGFFETTGYFSTNAKCQRDSSIWIAKVRKPSPKITSYDWGEKWVSNTFSKCTKNVNGVYVFDSIRVANFGSAPFIVKSLELIGADADSGYFSLGYNPQVNIGMAFVGDDTTEDNKRYQQVLFKPGNERQYSCKIVLTTEANEVAIGTLKGVGIESGVSITGFNFDTLEFVGEGITIRKGSIYISASRSKQLEVTDLEIYNDNFLEFSFESKDSFPSTINPLILMPNESKKYNIVFKPKRPGLRTANVRVTSNHPYCDDSVNVLKGFSYSKSAYSLGFNLQPIDLCSSGFGYLSVYNSGDVDIFIKDIEIIDTNSVFNLDPISLPKKVIKGDSLFIKVNFNPMQVGNYSAKIIVKYLSDSLKNFPENELEISGSAFTLSGELRTQTGLKMSQLDSFSLMVKLDKSLKIIKSKEVKFELEYTKENLDLEFNGTINNFFKGTIFNDWNVDILENIPGKLTLKLIAPTNEYLNDFGNIFNPKFICFASDITNFKYSINMELSDKLQCVSIKGTSGFGEIDSICGIKNRLIEITNENYSLSQNSPNPFNPSTNFNFSVGLNGQTTITLYNSYSQKIGVLLNKYLEPGKYKYTFDATEYSSGVYFYKLSSGTYSCVKSMIIQK